MNKLLGNVLIWYGPKESNCSGFQTLAETILESVECPGPDVSWDALTLGTSLQKPHS